MGRAVTFVSTKPSTNVAVELTEFLKNLGILLGWGKIKNICVNDVEMGTEVFIYKPGEAGIIWRLKEFYTATTSSGSDTKEIFLKMV